MVVGVVLAVALVRSMAADATPVSYADRFEAFAEQEVGAPLLVPLDPPPGYALFNALPARTWVPTGFTNGQVPTVTLCPVAPGVDPAGSCYGTEEVDHVAVLDLLVEDQRLVVVAQDGTGHDADGMLDDWRPVTYTSAWRSLDWITAPASPATDPA